MYSVFDSNSCVSHEKSRKSWMVQRQPWKIKKIMDGWSRIWRSPVAGTAMEIQENHWWSTLDKVSKLGPAQHRWSPIARSAVEDQENHGRSSHRNENSFVNSSIWVFSNPGARVEDMIFYSNFSIWEFSDPGTGISSMVAKGGELIFYSNSSIWEFSEPGTGVGQLSFYNNV